MTISKTIQLQLIGPPRTDTEKKLGKHHFRVIDVEPVWKEDTIVLFDFYIDGKWLGSRRLLRYIEEEYAGI